MKRKLAWICLLISPLVVGGAIVCFAERDPICRANWARIKKGMSQAEVEALLESKGYSLANGFGPVVVFWQGANGACITAFMDFGDPALVETVQFSQPQTFVGKIRHWLGF